MTPVLLDTDVVSYLFKQDTRAARYTEILAGRQRLISFMTVAELYQWTALHQWGTPRIKRLETHLEAVYAVLPFDVNVCRYWGDVRAECQRAGRPISAQDAWIAATALAFGVPLLTNNSDDFMAVSGLQMLNTGTGR